MKRYWRRETAISASWETVRTCERVKREGICQAVDVGSGSLSRWVPASARTQIRFEIDSTRFRDRDRIGLVERSDGAPVKIASALCCKRQGCSEGAFQCLTFLNELVHTRALIALANCGPFAEGTIGLHPQSYTETISGYTFGLPRTIMRSR